MTILYFPVPKMNNRETRKDLTEKETNYKILVIHAQKGLESIMHFKYAFKTKTKKRECVRLEYPEKY